MSHVMVVQGDARTIPLKTQSIHCVVTSPPYFNLRTYLDDAAPLKAQELGTETRHDCAGAFTDEACGQCYVCHIRQVMHEVWRVLRDDGTLWLNLADSMAGGSMTGGSGKGTITGTQHNRRKGVDIRFKHSRSPSSFMKPKNLLGIPWRVALALQADGWVLRSDIIWHATNKMPESVQDRPVRSYEHIFLFAKQPHYYYDALAIAEPAKVGFNGSSFTSAYDRATKPGLGEGERVERSTRNARNVWTFPTSPFHGGHYAAFPPELARRTILAGTSQVGCCPQCQAPWARQVECECYAQGEGQKSQDTLGSLRPSMSGKQSMVRNGHGRAGDSHTTTTGWAPSCRCYCTCSAVPFTDTLMVGPPACIDCGKFAWFARQPCIVFDPFVGSGTTLVVARALGRHGVGMDLSLDYLRDQARPRLQLDALAACEEYITTHFRASKGPGGNLNAQDYGKTPGQLGALPEGHRL